MSTSFDQMGFIEEPQESQVIPSEDPSVDFETLGFIEEAPVSEKAKEIAKGFKFFGLQPKPETIEPIRRKAGVALKELAGGLLGTPGDLIQFVHNFAGVEQPRDIIPTSDKIKKGFEKLAGEEFNPQNLGEEIIGQGAGALGSILGLGGPLKGTTAIKGALRTGLAALIPSSVAVLGEKAKLPKGVILTSTIGSALLTNRLTGKSLKQINSGLFKEAEQLAKNQTVSATKLSKELSSLDKILEKGVGTGPKTAIKGVVKDLQGKIKDGRIAVDELTAAKRDISERLGEFINIKGSKNLFKAAGKIVDDGIKTFEETNPKFKEVFRDANSLFKGRQEAQSFERFIKKHPILSAEAGLLLKLIKPSLGIKAVPTAVGIKSAEVLTALAPMASLQSTSRCTISISPTLEFKTRISTSFAPPPCLISMGSCSFAIFNISFLWLCNAFLAASMSDIWVT